LEKYFIELLCNSKNYFSFKELEVTSIQKFLFFSFFYLLLLFSSVAQSQNLASLEASNAGQNSDSYQFTRHRKREHRKVYILVEIAPDGFVKSASIYKSSGYPELDETALLSARKWKFSKEANHSNRIRRKIICVRFNPPLRSGSHKVDSHLQKEAVVCYILAEVSATGHVKSTALYKSSGDAELDRLALNAVKRWKLHPAKKGKHSVESKVIIPVQFHLKHYQKKAAANPTDISS
jgi:TonB family protein